MVDYHLGGLVSFINCLAGVNRGGGEDEEKGEKHQNPRLHLGRILEEILVLCFNVAALQLTAHASLALELTWHSPPVVYS